MNTELSGKMIWEGKIAVEMVNGWTDEAVALLIEALDEAVEEVFCRNEQAEIERNPLLRLALEI
jgi:DNA-binding MltR family transcriptional regulator